MNRARLQAVAWESVDNEAAVVLSLAELRWLLGRWNNGRAALAKARERAKVEAIVHAHPPRGDDG